MNYLEKILYRELYRKSLYDFVKDFWNTCDPSLFVEGKLIKYYCEIFQYFCRRWTGDEISQVEFIPNNKDDLVIDIREDKQNLCLNVPPRHSKSKIFNIFGPVWLWLSYPVKAVSISHTGELAKEMNVGRYNIINSDKFKEIFDDIEILINTSNLLRDNRGGELRSLNRNSFTGYGGDVIINDDLTNAETARKDMTEMENAWSYYKNTMPSRINNINKCIIMNIQQRLAPNDITGHILSDSNLSKTYTFVTIPACFENTTHFICPISGEVITYERGEYLWPERFNDYSSLRYQVGESVFETQYLQKPVASDVTIIKENMIIEKNLTECPSIDDADMIYASHDFPVKDKETSDFLGSTLAYKVGSTLYIKDCLEKRMSFNKSIIYVKQIDELFPGCIQIIEDKANGSPILQQLQDEVAGLQAYQPGTNSKTQRLESASLYMISGNVVFVKDVFNKLLSQYQLSENLENLKKRLLNFPFVEHDDVIDSFSQLLLFCFMDKRYSVYGRSFNDQNIIDCKNIEGPSTVFFNKEGDVWKIVEIKVMYGIKTKLYIVSEDKFKGSIQDGLDRLKELYPNKKAFIDCSSSDGMIGMYSKGIFIEKYYDNDFDKSVSQLNLAFSNKLILLDKYCKLTKNDIESFKFSKSKDENVKYITEKDGFIACLRIAMNYFGNNF